MNINYEKKQGFSCFFFWENGADQKPDLDIKTLLEYYKLLYLYIITGNEGNYEKGA